jgi:processive 1,2-diacylglycerol beta-glucosyltransferase
MERPDVLIVSASTGTGHLRAAEALRTAFAEMDPALRVEHVDLLTLAPRWVRSLYGAGFEMIAARAPRVWKGIYRLTDGVEHDRARWAPAAHALLFRAFRDLLRARPWSACLCTHFLPCQLAAGRPGLPPFALAITDLTLHRVWVQPGVRRYFVATEALAAELRPRAGGAAVEVTGIPIDPAVARVPDRAEARAEWELDADRPVALVAGGGLGIGVEEAVHAALAGAHPAVTVVAVCGRNEAARARLAALRLPPDRLRVLGFVRGLPTLMSAADVVATKAGGLSVSEALALGRPLLLTRPIPGAEEGNTRALERSGAALAGRSDAEMRAAFARVFSEPGLLPRLVASAAALGRPSSARAVAESVVREGTLTRQLAAATR